MALTLGVAMRGKYLDFPSPRFPTGRWPQAAEAAGQKPSHRPIYLAPRAHLPREKVTKSFDSLKYSVFLDQLPSCLHTRILLSIPLPSPPAAGAAAGDWGWGIEGRREAEGRQPAGADLQGESIHEALIFVIKTLKHSLPL